ncbi:hypothetical protein A3Q56_01777 [Intoshia linei]|uniref:Lysosomal dipeptide transporter MFSD1 n=1 Tax=Intoshia linei TaxID=1819745 RepID=A0A177B837_9BILA|nr:hypothetical protein A3Q56_01777 [Intoshia linei]
MDTQNLLYESNSEDVSENSNTCKIQIKTKPTTQTKTFRYFVGFLILFSYTGVIFSFDALTALSKHLANFPPGIDNIKLMNLFSCYSYPNIVLPFFIGYIIDRFIGIQNGTILFASIVFVGYTIEVCSVLFSAYWTMCVGRVIFGIGAESMQITQYKYIIKWFKPHGELNVIFGFLLSFVRIGTSLSLFTLPSIYNYFERYHFENTTTLAMTFCLPLASCGLSVIITIILKFIDIQYNSEYTSIEKELVNEPNQYEKIHEKIKITDFKNFSTSYYSITLIYFFYTSSITLFIITGNMILQHKFNYNSVDAGLMIGSVYIVSGLFSPLFGYVIKFMEYGINCMQFGLILLIVSNNLWCFTFSNPIITISLVSIGMAFIGCTLIPMISQTVDNTRVGMALGIIQSLQNMGLSVFNNMFGYISENYGYFLIEYILIYFVSLALICSFFLYLADFKNGQILNTPSCKKLKFNFGE